MQMHTNTTTADSVKPIFTAQHSLPFLSVLRPNQCKLCILASMICQRGSCSAVCTCTHPINHLVLNLVWVKASFLNTYTLTLEVSAGSVRLLEERVRKRHTKWLLCINVSKSKRMADRGGKKGERGERKRACEGA